MRSKGGGRGSDEREDRSAGSRVDGWWTPVQTSLRSCGERGQLRFILVILRCPYPSSFPEACDEAQHAPSGPPLPCSSCWAWLSPRRRTSGASNAALSDAAWAKQVCEAMPADELQRTYDGLRADRSGDVQFFAKDPDFVGSGLPHVGPWDYVQKVPMVWYGPGYINKGKVVNRNVTVADIAPTQADLFKTDFPTATGRPMDEALVPGEQRKGSAQARHDGGLGLGGRERARRVAQRLELPQEAREGGDLLLERVHRTVTDIHGTGTRHHGNRRHADRTTRWSLITSGSATT